MNGRAAKLLRKISEATGTDIKALKANWKTQNTEQRTKIREGLKVLIERGTIDVPRS